MRSEPDGDAALLRAVATGDEGALRLLVERNAPWLDARLRRRCADPDVVADVLQDTFVAAWNGAGRWRGDGEVAAWLWGIAVRRLVSRLRGRPAPAVGAAVEGHLASAEEQVLLGVEHGDLGAALRRLSPELRAVMQATALDGLTDREAAHLLGLPLGTVKGRLRRARRAAGRGPRRRVPAAARRPGDPPVRPAPAVPARRRPHRPRLRRRAGAQHVGVPARHRPRRRARRARAGRRRVADPVRDHAGPGRRGGGGAGADPDRGPRAGLPAAVRPRRPVVGLGGLAGGGEPAGPCGR